MHHAIPFGFEIETTFFTKADAPEGKQRRIGGLISTETPDRQGEMVLQSGLDFNDFLKNGWFNDNHSRSTAGILGYPEEVQRFAKGAALPTGKAAQSNGTWVEGHLVDTDDAEKIWKLGKALQKTDRRLGFSVEGKIQRRGGPRTILKKSPDGKKEWVGSKIVKAIVRNVAITGVPVQTDSQMELLAKSLLAIEQADPSDLEKALAMGTATPGQKPAGPKTGKGAGKVLVEEHLEEEEKDLIGESERQKKEKERTKKALSDAEAIQFVRSKLPHVNLAAVGRIVDLTKRLKMQGDLKRSA